MKIEHIAIWTNDLERLRDFYMKYFEAKSNELYHNPKKGFKSYFLSFKEGARIEVMSKDNLSSSSGDLVGYAHLAMAVTDKSLVISLTERLSKDGYLVVSEPRTTGDGYFESVILDPDGNKIEITC